MHRHVFLCVNILSIIIINNQPGALDLTITSPLNSTVLSEASVRAASATQAAESHKHQVNDAKCQELGWACIP